VAVGGTSVLVRDSRSESGVILEVMLGRWLELLSRIRDGELG
jgi:hypothetical protein